RDLAALRRGCGHGLTQFETGVLALTGAEQALFRNGRAVSGQIYSRTMVARPRKIRKPKKSVVAVTKTAEDTAGSNFSLASVSGVSTPTLAATSRFRIMAVAITPPILQSWNQKPAARPISGARTKPLARPTAISRQKVRRAFEAFSSRVARARTVTVKACVPALPPMAE